jgi:hypothetical protein
LTQKDLVNFLGTLALSDGLATSIRSDPTDQTIQRIASELSISLSQAEIDLIKDKNVEIEVFCKAVQPIVYDGNGGKSR